MLSTIQHVFARVRSPTRFWQFLNACKSNSVCIIVEGSLFHLDMCGNVVSMWDISESW